jgi:DegV family protein with EDD domain
MMTVRIVTDSGADIPEEICSELGIVVVPLTVSFGIDSYQDGVDLKGDEFYRRLIENDAMPTTSQPAVGSFVEAYDALKESAADVLSIHVSSKLSGTLNSATQATSQTNLGSEIRLLDSKQVSMGFGFSVMAAAEAANQGASLEETAAVAQSTLDRTSVFVLLDTLKYLEKGGRMGKASAIFGTVLQIKPILTLNEGVIAIQQKIRTFRKGIQSLSQLVDACGPLERAAVLYTTDSSAAVNFSEKLKGSLPEGSAPWTVRLSPAIGTHGGPGVLGVVCVSA